MQIPIVVSDFARSRAEIVAVWLFGSQSDGTAGAGSDIDLGILFESAGDLDRVATAEVALARALGRPVDVVDAARAGAFLALEIIRGDRVFTRDHSRADEFELYVLRRAGDLEHFERERRRLLLDPRRPLAREGIAR